MGTAFISRTKATDNSVEAFRIANTVALAAGDYVGVNDAAGDAVEISDADGVRPLGFVVGFTVLDTGVTDTGDTAAADPPRAKVDIGGGIQNRVAVTGVTGQLNVGKPVYATGINTFTLTETNFLPAVGIVVRWHVATTCDVYFFSAAQIAAAQGGAQGQREILHLGSISTLALRATNQATLHRKPLPGYGRLRGVWAQPAGFHAGHNTGSLTLSLLIGTTTVGAATAVTGGRTLLRSTQIDASGDLVSQVSGTAVTGGQEWDEGANVFIRRESGGAAFTATAPVTYELWAQISRSAAD